MRSVGGEGNEGDFPRAGEERANLFLRVVEKPAPVRQGIAEEKQSRMAAHGVVLRGLCTRRAG